MAPAAEKNKQASRGGWGAPLRTLTQRKGFDILQGAVQEFQAKGFLATSMDAVAARAGVSKRTVYNHFASKENLFQAVVLELIEQKAQTQVYEYRPEQPLAAQVKEIAQQQIEYFTKPGRLSLARVVVSESIRRPEMGKWIYQKIDKLQGGLVGWIKQAAADGRLQAPDPVLAARLFNSLIGGMAFWPLVLGGRQALRGQKLADLAQAITGMFLGHFGRGPS